jgi:hypothetical protein
MKYLSKKQNMAFCGKWLVGSELILAKQPTE